MSRKETSQQTIGEQIKSRREELGLTQKMLGKQVGWPDSRIGAYERDECCPSIKSLQILSKALSIDFC